MVHWENHFTHPCIMLLVFPFNIFHVGIDKATLPFLALGSGLGFTCCSFRDSQLVSLLVNGMTDSPI